MTTPMRRRFADLHLQGTFVLPNPWDVGSARILEHLGFPALATTSSGLAASLGRPDQRVSRDELVAHVAALTATVGIPVSVDAEYGYADEPGGVARTVDLLADAGAAGFSIEDYHPEDGGLLPPAEAADCVGAAVQAARKHGLVVTARAENHLYGATDLADTLARLRAYREAGADVVYAPGVRALADVARLVRAVGAPLNVLALPGGPSVTELAAVGVRRVSTGGSLAWAAYGGLVTAAQELLGRGTSSYLASALDPELRAAALG